MSDLSLKLPISLQQRPMNSNNQPPSEALSILWNIIEKASDQPYFFRGEPKHHLNVSSGLFRKFGCLSDEYLCLDFVQLEILEEVAAFAPELSDQGPSKILSHLQHSGYQTNFIDFTSDFLVSLFFACDGEGTDEDLENKDGRVILLARNRTEWCSPSDWDNRWNNFVDTNRIDYHKPYGALEMTGIGRSPQNQKSILIHAPDGLVKPCCCINIPSSVKRELLSYLDKFHNIRADTIYNDLHGFIRYRRLHRSRTAEMIDAYNALKKDCVIKANIHVATAVELLERIRMPDQKQRWLERTRKLREDIKDLLNSQNSDTGEE